MENALNMVIAMKYVRFLQVARALRTLRPDTIQFFNMLKNERVQIEGCRWCDGLWNEWIIMPLDGLEGSYIIFLYIHLYSFFLILKSL